METYFVVFVFFALFSMGDILPISHRAKMNILSVLTFSAIFLIGGRYWCDNDFENYATFFIETPSIYETTPAGLLQLYLFWQIEPGYILAASILKALGFGYQSMFIFCAILTFIPITKSSRQISPYPILSFFLFLTTLFTLPFVQMRFGVATACVFYALVQLDSQNKYGYWKWMIIGLLFHMTALIGFVMYWVYTIKLTRKQSFLLLFCSFIFSLIPIKFLFANIISLLGFYRYTSYANEEASSMVSLLFIAILLLPFIYYEPILRERVKHYHLLLVMGLSTILIGSITREVPILNRFSLLLSVSYTVIIPSYLLLFKYNAAIICTWILLIVYAFLKFRPSLDHIGVYQNFIYQ